MPLTGNERSIEVEPHELRVVNLLATAELGQPVNLPRLTGVKGFLYDEAICRCAYFKDKRTRAKVIIFRTGKIICVGAKDIRSASRASRPFRVFQ